MDKLICPLCDSQMDYKQYKLTHIWVCPECPAILFEYWNGKNIVDLKNYVNQVGGAQSKSFDKISLEGAQEYLSSYIEEMQSDIDNKHPKSRLYEERIIFFSKLLEPKPLKDSKLREGK